MHLDLIGYDTRLEDLAEHYGQKKVYQQDHAADIILLQNKRSSKRHIDHAGT